MQIHRRRGDRYDWKERIPMTAGQNTRRLSTVSLAPALLAALLAATLLAGVLIGAALALQLGSGTSASVIGAGAQPAATFDAVKFRAEEHAAIQPLPALVGGAPTERRGGK
jgi:hypothetical protein